MQRNQIGTEITKKRFIEKVSFEALTGCWIWSGAVQHAYGKFRIGLKEVRAHRASWEIHKGPIPDGMSVLHQCDTPLCVNPDHLFIGTQQENMNDRKTKGRVGKIGAHNKEKTHCPSGHELQGENLYIHRGGRYCRACRKNHFRNYKEQLK